METKANRVLSACETVLYYSTTVQYSTINLLSANWCRNREDTETCVWCYGIHQTSNLKPSWCWVDSHQTVINVSLRKLFSYKPIKSCSPQSASNQMSGKVWTGHLDISQETSVYSVFKKFWHSHIHSFFPDKVLHWFLSYLQILHFTTFLYCML